MQGINAMVAAFLISENDSRIECLLGRRRDPSYHQDQAEAAGVASRHLWFASPLHNQMFPPLMPQQLA
jgi:hypothetical protein